MKTEHFMVSTLDFFQVVFHEKRFFPKFELLNSECGLSASAAYLRVFTVIACSPVLCMHYTLHACLASCNLP